MKKAEYIKKYGTEAYIRKQYRPKYRTAAIRKAKVIVPKPVAVGKRPKGLGIFAEHVKMRQLKYHESYKIAKKEVYNTEYWRLRREFQKYPKKVQEHIKAAYKIHPGRHKVMGPMGELISFES